MSLDDIITTLKNEIRLSKSESREEYRSGNTHEGAFEDGRAEGLEYAIGLLEEINEQES